MAVGKPDVVEFRLGDVVRLRRAHPCGSREWLVDRLGADIGLRCRGCDRHVLIERRALERRLTDFVSRGDLAMSQAVAPLPRDSGAPTRDGGR
ncbi:MAG: DUF951 domain-containing protein [Candidatus Limnocylindrales bacterium]